MVPKNVNETKENLFPELGRVAEETDQLPDIDDDKIAHSNLTEAGGEGDEGKAVQEIESLCMNCRELVSSALVLNMPLFNGVMLVEVVGHDTAAAHKHTLLSRSDRHVLQMRTLRMV